MNPQQLIAITARGPLQVVRLYGRSLSVTEKTVLNLFRQRLDALEHEGHDESVTASVTDEGPLGDLLDGLLHQSLSQSVGAARDQLYASLLQQLVPDEARILAAVAERGAPLVHIYTRGKGPGASRAVLENAAGVGRGAGLSLPDLAPSYVTHLLALGLVEAFNEDPALAVELEILMADPTVRTAIKQAEDLSLLPPRIVRRTLRLSPLGLDLWTACRPDDGPPPAPAA